jgi:D-methionine transport system ATP-binding protein
MIQLNSVSKRFKAPDGAWFSAVNTTSLHIKEGEIFGLIGYSGAGKSTLLRLINLLERPDSGQVLINNQDLMPLTANQLRQARLNIGMVFQQFNLLANRTVAQNIALPLEIAGWPQEQIDKRVIECLDIVQLSDRSNHYPAQLSGGQKQRVGIARALAAKPQVILADEPTSALDPQTTKSVLECLRDINQRFGVTIVVVTHDMPVIHAICHRAALCHAGEIAEIFEVIDGKNTAHSDRAKQLLGEIQ